jgi:transcriptional regulator with XRE-family HTH domain
MAKPGRTDPLTESLGRVIATIRRDRGLSQEALAARTQMHPTSISHIERGVNSPTVRILSRIATALGVTTSELLAAAEVVEGP